jgi:hypothetical protein
MKNPGVYMGSKDIDITGTTLKYNVFKQKSNTYLGNYYMY